jgi:hypothetical protein
VDRLCEVANKRKVLLSYYVQAALCSSFTALILWELWRHKRHRIAGRKIQLITDSCKASLDIFNGGLEIITLSMIAATIFIAASTSPHRDYIQILLAQELTIFSIFSVFLMVVLNDLSFPDSKRNPRLFIYLPMVALYIVELYYADWSIKNAEGVAGEALCFGDSWMALRIVGSDLRWTYFGLAWLLILVFVLLPCVCKSWLPNVSQRLLNIRRQLKVPTAIFLGLCMWGHLVNVTIARHRFVEQSGSNIEDARWTFGQVIALFTWLPVIMELYYLLRSKFIHLFAPGSD